MLAMSAPSKPPSGRPIASADEAQQVIAHLGEVMDALLTTLEQETQLVRAGRLRDAARLQEPKGDLARLYVADVLRLRASRQFLAQSAPEALAGLQRRHDAFRARLQLNLTVLATAHAISEGIIRGVCSELQRKAAPQTYGASGRASVPARNTVLPLAVSRSL
jgi:hypothetical protein